MANNVGPSAEVRAEELKLRMHYPKEFHPVGVSFVGLSRMNTDVQLDLGVINFQEFVERAQEQKGKQKTLDVQVVHSAYLSPAAFMKLHADVTRFYALMKSEGLIKDGQP